MKEIKKTKLLIVEGTHDKGFFESLIKHLALNDIQVMPIGGKDQLPSRLEALKNADNFDTVITLGIMRDADDNPKGAFQSICDALKKNKLPVPSKQLALSKGKKQKTAIMIFPETSKKGMLEDVCLESVKDSEEMKCVSEYLKCIKDSTGQLPEKHKMSKSKIQALLAIKPEPGLHLGLAALEGYWQWEDSAFDKVKEFLKLL